MADKPAAMVALEPNVWLSVYVGVAGPQAVVLELSVRVEVVVRLLEPVLLELVLLRSK